jgi:hypothetical protein
MDDIDHDDDDATATDDIAATMPDPFSAVLLLLDAVADPKTTKSLVRNLAKLTRQITDAETKLSGLQASAAEIAGRLERDIGELQQREAALDAREREREAALAEAREQLVEREQKIARLERAWRNLGEPADVLSGLRAPEFSSLQKARAAHGRPPGRPLDPLLFAEQDSESDAAIDAIIRRDVGDSRSDHLGLPFASSSLSRSTEHKRGAA